MEPHNTKPSLPLFIQPSPSFHPPIHSCLCPTTHLSTPLSLSPPLPPATSPPSLQPSCSSSNLLAVPPPLLHPCLHPFLHLSPAFHLSIPLQPSIHPLSPSSPPSGPLSIHPSPPRSIHPSIHPSIPPSLPPAMASWWPRPLCQPAQKDGRETRQLGTPSPGVSGMVASPVSLCPSVWEGTQVSGGAGKGRQGIGWSQGGWFWGHWRTFGGGILGGIEGARSVTRNVTRGVTMGDLPGGHCCGLGVPMASGGGGVSLWGPQGVLGVSPGMP